MATVDEMKTVTHSAREKGEAVEERVMSFKPLSDDVVSLVAAVLEVRDGDSREAWAMLMTAMVHAAIYTGLEKGQIGEIAEELWPSVEGAQDELRKRAAMRERANSDAPVN